MRNKKTASRFFLLIVILLAVTGFMVFSSASLGRLDTENVTFLQVISKQGLILLAGLAAMIATYNIPYQFWRKYGLFIFSVSLLATLLVFIPGLGVKSGGATSWIDIGPINFQPSEFLKFALVIYWAAWIASVKKKINTFKWGFLPFLGLMAISGALLMAQPDTGTFAVIFITALTMFFIGGAKKSHIALALLIGLIGFALVVSQKPYIQDRITTFFDNNTDPQGTSYQVKRSLIAVGSGGAFGRGFGQSIQKFNLLPEPMTDSIYAVAAEEFGLWGSSLIVLLFVLYAVIGFKIAGKAPDAFSRLLTAGIVILIVFQSFINIGTMLAVAPLTGLPLIFYSHGGTALLFALIGSGVVLQVSKHTVKK